MKKVFTLMVLFAAFALVGCTSKEEKAAKLIERYMFNYLDEYRRYEPIETKIEPINEPVGDIAIITLGYELGSCWDDYNQYVDEMGKYDKRSAVVSLVLEDVDVIKSIVDIYEQYVMRLNSCYEVMVEIRNLASQQDTTKVTAWKASHLYRIMNDEGEGVLQKETFLIDKRLKEILLYHMDNDINGSRVVYRDLMETIHTDLIDEVQQHMDETQKKIDETKEWLDEHGNHN